MGFNSDKFKSPANSSVLDRIVSSASAVAQRVGGNKGYVDLVSGILTSGASVDTIKSIASMQLDRELGSISDDFFSRIGLKTNKNRLKSPNENSDFIYKQNGDVSTTRYPHDLGAYAVGLRFSQYKRPAPDAPAVPPDVTKVIYLPLPRELRQLQSSSMSAPELGLIGGLADAIQSDMEGNPNKDGAQAGATTRGAVTVGAMAALRATSGSAMRLVVAGVLGNEGKNVASQYAGASINPNIGVVYNGPNLREFNLNWEFNPTSAEESKTLNEIIKEIQKRSLATRAVAGSSMILAYPEMVQVTMMPHQLDKLMFYKKALIKSVNVDYASNGIPTFFEGTKLPTFISLSISFQEIEYFLGEDFGATARGFNGKSSDEFIKDFDSIKTTIKDESVALFKDAVGGDSSAPPDAPTDNGG